MPVDIVDGSNIISWGNLGSSLSDPIPLGILQAEVVSNEFSGIIEINVTFSDSSDLEFDYSGQILTNVNFFKVSKKLINRATVVAAPGNYNFSSNFVMDEEYVDLVSLDGNRSIIFNGSGTISITANDVFVKGVDVQDKNFTIGNNLNLLKVENCKGGDFSFGGVGITSGTFNNCVGGDGSFGGFGGTASGTFTNCVGSNLSFSGFGTASGTFINCQSSGNSFGMSGTASGTFINCQGGNFSFGGGGTLSGKLYYCRLTEGTFETVSGGGVIVLCIDGNNQINTQN